MWFSNEVKIKSMKKINIFDIVIILFLLAGFVGAMYFYPILPDRVITHWNWVGQADGWGTKTFSTIGIPIIMLAMYILFKFLPKIDPHHQNYQNFAKAYSAMQLAIIGLLTVIYFVTNLVNLGYNLSIAKIVPAIIGAMFIIMGFYLKDIKLNWFVGIKTPWTLSSETVWHKTHVFGSKVFILSGVLFLIAPYLPASFALYFFIIFMALVLSTIVYSYLVFKQEKKS